MSYVPGKPDQMSSNSSTKYPKSWTGGGSVTATSLSPLAATSQTIVPGAFTVGSQISASITYASNPNQSITVATTVFDDSDMIIRMKDGTDLKVGKSIRMLMEHLLLIVPDDRELESNPALKMAYENYLRIAKRSLDPELVEAYESYQMMRKITRDA